MRNVCVLLLIVIGMTSVGSAQDKPVSPPSPLATSALDQKQIQQATLIKARAGELDRDYADAIVAIETAAQKLSSVKAEQKKLNDLAAQVAPQYLKSLGAKDGDTFDWGTLAINVKPAAKK